MNSKKILAIMTAVALITANLPQVMAVDDAAAVETDSGAVSTLAEVSGDFEYEVIFGEYGIVSITKYNGEGGDVVIPEEIEGIKVIEIGHSAFSNCTSLTSVEIPSSVNMIGRFAFSGCTSLTSIKIPNGVTEILGVFNGCSSLTSVEIPSSVTMIGDAAFGGCTSLTSIEIPNSVTEIGSSAFEYCTSLTSVEIPNSVTEIGLQAFSGCTSLTSVEIPNSVTMIGDAAFHLCTSLTNISVDENNTKYSSKDGVLYNKDMSKLVIYPEGKKELSFKIPNGVTEIGGSAFSNCTSLTSVEIPSSVTEIGDSAFRGCTSLTSVEIPSSVTEIGSSAFMDCTSLTSVEIPNSVFWFGWRVFDNCSEDLTIYGVSGSNAETYAKENKINFTAITSIKPEGDTNGVTVQAPAALPADTVLKAEKTNETEDGTTYNITLTSKGENVDLNGKKAIVKIPVPEGGKVSDYKVYRKEADGSYTDMKAVPSGDCLMFFTDHFSEYVITTKNPEDKPAEPAPTESTSAESTPTDSTPADSSTTTTENAGGSKGEGNQPTGIIFAVIPAIAATSAVVIFKRRK